MDLKDQIKEIVRKMLDEESVSGDIGVGAGPISTPNWVAPKGQKKNKATKEAENLGMKVVKKGLPKNSKIYDYKEMWPGKHSAMNEEKIKVDVPEEVAKDLEANGFTSLNDLFKKSLANRQNLSIETKHWIQQVFLPQIKGIQPTHTLQESVDKIVKSKLLNEVSYGKFKKDISYRSKTEMLHKGIKEVKRKIQEIDRIVEYTSRMKQELSEGDAVQYWTRTEAQLQQISEMVNNLNEKINKLK
jgi:predicted XRE-type DNA-binding protein